MIQPNATDFPDYPDGSSDENLPSGNETDTDSLPQQPDNGTDPLANVINIKLAILAILAFQVFT